MMGPLVPAKLTSNQAPTGDAFAQGNKSNPKFASFDRCNWLLHFAYVTKDWARCLSLADHILSATNNYCEYAHYVKGMVNLQLGKADESIKMLEKCLQFDRFNSSHIRQIGCSLLFTGQHERAIGVFEEALIYQPDDWAIYYWKAVCFYYMKDMSKAKDNLKLVLSHLKHEDSLILLSRILQSESSFDESIQFYKRSIEIAPENCNLQTSLGLVYLKVGNYRLALEAFGRALSLNSFHTEAVFAVGAVMHHHGDYDTALAKYRVGLKNFPDNARLWNNIGMCFYGKTKTVAAICCLKRAHYLAPLEWKILYNLGLVHLEVKQLTSAFHFLSAALQFNNSSSLLYVILAVALESLEDYPNAAHAFEKALSHDRSETFALYNYAAYLGRQGDHAGLRKWAEIFSNQLNATQASKGEVDTKIDSRLLQAAEELRKYLK
uniref:TPR_REGION domain-containing protein n=1 Tax=Trichuris muris TaxID=70415 RepID=A0A5S6Q876_TRIMR